MDKIVWILTLDRENKKYKVVRSKKEIQAEYAKSLDTSKTEMLSLSANIYISFNCKALHDLAKFALSS